jgi:flavin-dependent dehydrogenase
MDRRAIVIVGSGPAGAGTALALARADPALAGEVVVLEKARHPRDKTCAGGVIPKAVQLLRELDIPFAVPHRRVDHAGVAVPGRPAIQLPGTDLCRVVRRSEFDAQLAWTARDRGVDLREKERVTHLARDGAGVRVETDRRTYWAPAVVGADGSGSVVRRALIEGRAGAIARAVMCDVPIEATHWDGWDSRRYEFDFTPCPAGLRGYRWTFPCVIDGRPHANVGVYALPPVDGARLQAELSEELRRLGVVRSPRAWKAFPIRTYDAAAAVAAPHVLLAGDAAGCDPLMGEGISFALEYGQLASAAILDARARGDLSFRRYARAVAHGALGRKLRFLGFAARHFYGRRPGMWFGLASASTRAQRMGLAWYNGASAGNAQPGLAEML